MILQTLRDVAAPELTSGILAVIFISCAVFAIKTYFTLTEAVFSVGASVFDGHVYRLFTYPFYHKTFAQLLLNIAVLVLLCGSFERSVGTVRFLFLFLLLSTCTGLWYAFLDLLQSDATQSHHVEGLVPIALAFIAVTTMHTRMAKGFLFGVSVPTIALPWLFLIITTILIPHTVLPCNVIAILIGWMYGKGWFSFLDMSEARASVLEKMMPFRFLRNITCVQYIPADTEERRKTLLPQINPTPGSYPVQAYAPLSSINTTETTPHMYEGWPNSTNALSSPIPSFPTQGHGAEQSFGPSHGHSCNHSYNHSHDQL
ncbi:rhomboid domain-containing protein 2 [Polymixia lowei]